MSIDQIANILIEHTAATCFWAALLWGNSAALVFAITAGMGVIDPLPVFVFSTLGNFGKDTLFFHLGRTRLIDRITAAKRIAPAYERLNRLREKNAHHDLKVFIVVKFMYGLRLLSVTYFGSLNYPFARYAAFNSIALIIINAFIVAVGWGAGRGVGETFDPFSDFRSGLTFVLAVAVVYSLIRIATARLFGKENGVLGTKPGDGNKSGSED
jgi:membrane protein DedA with SNARE-associated domain